ncbi:MAG: twin-arginine translocase TatA/TatE family subunit [Chloroflexi bacterium]|nr:twin-arginine translocase TatA/TatE family subunit [Chloroflexota bacterium]
MNFLGIGGFEIIIVAGLAFFLLGPKKMIETSRTAGKMLRELKSERDKFTSMVMQEFDPDGHPNDTGEDSDAATPGPNVAGVGPIDPPEGAISGPRGPMQDAAAAPRPASPTAAADEPVPSGGGST